MKLLMFGILPYIYMGCLQIIGTENITYGPTLWFWLETNGIGRPTSGPKIVKSDKNPKQNKVTSEKGSQEGLQVFVSKSKIYYKPRSLGQWYCIESTKCRIQSSRIIEQGGLLSLSSLCEDSLQYRWQTTKHHRFLTHNNQKSIPRRLTV